VAGMPALNRELPMQDSDDLLCERERTALDSRTGNREQRKPKRKKQQRTNGSVEKAHLV
jgi:hypothetical protein